MRNTIILLPLSRIIPLIHMACLVLAGTALLALSAQATIPLLPVPVTLQTSAVILLGTLFGPWISVLMVSTYLFEGLMGLPVFAHFSSGIPVLLGPTGGYILGFLPASAIAGYLAHRGWNHNIGLTLISVTLSTIALFTVGICYLAHLIGWHNAYLFGAQSFYLTELAKIVTLTGIIHQLNHHA